jgi:predicted TIM-barrel fold metal-dependent hydrolase
VSQSTHPHPTRFGRIHPPDEAWLATAPAEPILEPELTIIDTHHHLWQRPGHRYFLEELLADLRTGHHVVATVFVECHARCMFESNFPVEKMGIGYASLWNAFKRIAAGASAGEKLALFSGTARRAYRLD